MDRKNYIGNREITKNTLKYLFDAWMEISNQLSTSGGCTTLYLFLDYDGTLVPIANTPKDALLSQEQKQFLHKLSQYPEIQLWIISGRSIDDIRRLVGIDGIGYVGNHGFEIQCPDHPVKEFYTPDHKEAILKIQELLNAHFIKYNGVFLENKGPILAIHYRLAKTGIEREILRFIESIKDIVQRPFNVGYGKKVIEIRTVHNKSKGTALKWIKKHAIIGKNVCSGYLGDDETDEDAFRVLGTKDIGIFIGKPLRQTSAKYYLLNVDEVWDFLFRLYRLLHKRVGLKIE